MAFFGSLTSDWYGWQGERSYELLEHDLRLTAAHDGHVRLAVQLRQASVVPDGWSASAVIRLDPDEEMTRAAEDLATLLRTVKIKCPGVTMATRDRPPVRARGERDRHDLIHIFKGWR